MDLAPAAVLEAEYARSAQGQCERFAFGSEMAALATHGVEEVAGAVESVVEEFDLHLGGALENAFVDAVDAFPAALHAANRVVEGDIGRMIPIFLHQAEIAVVEGAIKL